MYDKHYTGKRNGFSMFVAIFVIVLVAWLGSQILHVAANESKSTGDRYLRYQAELLADSATDYAVMRIGAYDDESNNCLQDINITVNDVNNVNPMYDIVTKVYYSFENAAPTGCPAQNVLAAATGLETMVLIDTTVTARDNLSTEQIRIHQRSWQKP